MVFTGTVYFIPICFQINMFVLFTVQWILNILLQHQFSNEFIFELYVFRDVHTRTLLQ